MIDGVADSPEPQQIVIYFLNNRQHTCIFTLPTDAKNGQEKQLFSASVLVDRR
jgi:hypothetical protein